MRIYIESKRVFQDLQSASQTKEGKEFWGKRIAFCNKKMAQEMAKSLKAMVIIINVGVLLTIIFFSGCNSAEAGLNFGGAVFKDAGWILTELSENITVKEK